MNSLLEFEGLGGQVQMIYIDPPYGVKFGSNFQPFVRKRDVKHGGRRGHDARTGDGEGVSGYLGVSSPLMKSRFFSFASGLWRG